jgi:hypothetical protein
MSVNVEALRSEFEQQREESATQWDNPPLPPHTIQPSEGNEEEKIDENTSI